MSERNIHVEVEVPGTPEQVWDAIATGPGITSWFMPVHVDGREGGEIVHGHGQDVTSTGTITTWDPPHRFVYEEEGGPLGLGRPLATEWLVEARGGGTCVVRLVMSGFGPGDEFEKAMESFADGWRTMLHNNLRLYLTHFAGQTAAPITASGAVHGRAKDDVWTQLRGALGIPAEPVVGERVAASADDGPTLAGTVADHEPGMLTLLLDEPAPGLGFVGVGSPGDEVFAVVRAHLFGHDAPTVAARDEPGWQAFVREQF